MAELIAELNRFCEVCKDEKRQSCVNLNGKWSCKSCLDKAMTLIKVAKPYTRYTLITKKHPMAFLIGGSDDEILSLEEDGMEFFGGKNCDEVREKLEKVRDALNFYEAHKNDFK
jgi:hypothetical protein